MYGVDRYHSHLTEKGTATPTYFAQDLWSQSNVHFVPVKRTTCHVAVAGGFRPYWTVLLLVFLSLPMLLDQIER